MAGTDFIGDSHLYPDPPVKYGSVQRALGRSSQNTAFSVGTQNYEGAHNWSFDNIDLDRAQRQAGWQQGLNAVGRTLINGTLDIFGNTAAILDVEDYFNQDLEVGNVFTRAVEDAKQAVNKALPIHRENPGKTFDLSDPAYWWENGSSLGASMLGFAATGGLLAKGLQAINMTRGAGILTTATALNQAESIQIASQVFDETFQRALDQKKLYNPEQIEKQINKEAEAFYSNALSQEIKKQKGTPGIDGRPMDNISVQSKSHDSAVKATKEFMEKRKEELGAKYLNEGDAIKAAGEAASYAIKINRANIALNLTSAGLFFRNPAAVSKLLKKRGAIKNLKTAGEEGFKEYGEEIINHFSEKEAYRQTTDILQGKQYQFSPSNLAADFLTEEAQEAGVLGFIGGAGQTALTKGVVNNLRTTNSVKRDDNGLPVRNEKGELTYEKISPNTQYERAYNFQQKALEDIGAIKDENGLYDVSTLLNEATTQNGISSRITALEYLLHPLSPVKPGYQDTRKAWLEKTGMKDLVGQENSVLKEKLEALKKAELKNKVFLAASVNATEGLIGMYQQLQNISPEEAAEKGYREDYKKIASDIISDIKHYQSVYDKIPNRLKTPYTRDAARAYLHTSSRIQEIAEASSRLNLIMDETFSAAVDQAESLGIDLEVMDKAYEEKRDFEGSPALYKEVLKSVRKQKEYIKELKELHVLMQDLLQNPENYSERENNIREKVLANHLSEKLRVSDLSNMIRNQDEKGSVITKNNEPGKLVSAEGVYYFIPEDGNLEASVVESIKELKEKTVENKKAEEKNIKAVLSLQEQMNVIKDRYINMAKSLKKAQEEHDEELSSNLVMALELLLEEWNTLNDKLSLEPAKGETKSGEEVEPMGEETGPELVVVEPLLANQSQKEGDVEEKDSPETIIDIEEGDSTEFVVTPTSKVLPEHGKAKKSVYNTTRSPEYLLTLNEWEKLIAEDAKSNEVKIENLEEAIRWANVLSRLGQNSKNFTLKVVMWKNATKEEQESYFTKANRDWMEKNPGNDNSIKVVLQINGKDHLTNLWGVPEDDGKPVVGSIATSLFDKSGKMIPTKKGILEQWLAQEKGIFDQNGESEVFIYDGKEHPNEESLRTAILWAGEKMSRFIKNVSDSKKHPQIKITGVSKGFPFARDVSEQGPVVGTFVETAGSIRGIHIAGNSVFMMKGYAGTNIDTSPGHTSIEDVAGNIVEAVNDKVTSEQANLVIDLILFGTSKGGALINNIIGEDGESYTIFDPKKEDPTKNIFKKILFWGPAREGKKTDNQVYITQGHVIYGNKSISLEQLKLKEGDQYKDFFTFLTNKYQNTDVKIQRGSKGKNHKQPISIKDGKIVHKDYKKEGFLSGYEVYLTTVALNTRVRRKSKNDPVIVGRYLEYEVKTPPAQKPVIKIQGVQVPSGGTIIKKAGGPKPLSFGKKKSEEVPTDIKNTDIESMNAGSQEEVAVVMENDERSYLSSYLAMLGLEGADNINSRIDKFFEVRSKDPEYTSKKWLMDIENEIDCNG